MKRFIFFVILVVVFGGCAKNKTTTTTSIVSSDDNSSTNGVPVEIGKDTVAYKLYNMGFQTPKAPFPAPDFEFYDLKGGKVKLSDFKGNVILLNLWATWCPPCRAEMPSIEKLFKKMGNTKFKIIALSVNEEKSTVTNFLKTNPYTFPIYLDEVGNSNTNYASGSIPTTYIIDKDGIIQGRVVGAREWDTDSIVDLIKNLIEGI